MASPDKKHKKKLKEADKAFQKQYKLLKSGKITKEEFKKKIKPFKKELIELGYPIKSSGEDEETEEKPEEAETEKVEKPQEKPEEERKVSVKVNPWKKKSQLTIEEIESRVDELSLGGRPSDGLRKLYQERYGEELESPEQEKTLLPYEFEDESEAETEMHTEEESDETEEPEETKKSKKGIFKSVFGKSRND